MAYNRVGVTHFRLWAPSNTVMYPARNHLLTPRNKRRKLRHPVQMPSIVLLWTSPASGNWLRRYLTPEGYFLKERRFRRVRLSFLFLRLLSRGHNLKANHLIATALEVNRQSPPFSRRSEATPNGQADLPFHKLHFPPITLAKIGQIPIILFFNEYSGTEGLLGKHLDFFRRQFSHDWHTGCLLSIHVMTRDESYRGFLQRAIGW